MFVLAVADYLVAGARGTSDQAAASIVMLVGLALGGHLTVNGFDLPDLAIRPLGLTLVGMILLGMIFVRRLRRVGPPTRTAVALQVVRLALLYLVVIAIIGATGHVASGGVDLGSTVLFGLLALAITVLVAVVAGVPEVFSGIGTPVRAALAGVLKGLWLMLCLSTAGIVILTFVLYRQDDYAQVSTSAEVRGLIETVLTFLPNWALYFLFVGLGIPINVDLYGSIDAPIVHGSRSVLWRLVHEHPLYWLLPIVAGGIVLLGALRAVGYARRQGVRFGGSFAFGLAFPFVALLAAGVLSVGDSLIVLSVASIEDGYRFNLFSTLMAGVAWGLACGVLAEWLSRSPRLPIVAAAAGRPQPFSPKRYPGPPKFWRPAAITTPINVVAIQTALFLAGVTLIAILILVTKP